MAKRRRSRQSSACPCGSGLGYGACCQALHDGSSSATTAEALMRARYSAYVRRDEHFLLRSWHPDTRPVSVSFDGGQEWLGLSVLEVDAGSSFESVGRVEFYARFRISGVETALHENSTFVRVDGEWVYVDGELLTGV